MWPFSKTRGDSVEAEQPKQLKGAARADGWFSALTGYGTGRDKRMSVSFASDVMDDNFASELWRGDDMSARVVETIPNECFRQGFEVNVGDKQLGEDIMAMTEELNVLANYKQAKNFERAYGGSAIWPVINDGQSELAMPLNEETISEISHLMVFEARELQPDTYYQDPNKPKFGEVEIFNMVPYSRGGVSGASAGQLRIHESRLIQFQGIRTSRRQMSPNGWGDSVLARTYSVMRDFGIAWAATGVMLHDFSQAEFKIKGLADLMANDRDDVIKTRIQTIALAKSVLNMVLMDSEESMERKQTPTSGLPELLDRFATRVAAAADMPVTLLMGQSPAGLNATGESDIRFFYDRVASIQKLGIQPQLERLIYLLLRARMGPAKGKEPERWSVKFNPLWQPSELEQANIRKTVADTDAVNIGMGLYSADEAALAHYGGDGFSIEMQIDFDERKRINDAADRAEAEARLAKEGADGVTSVPGAVAATGDNVAATAMNGAQVTSLVDVVAKVNTKEISRESAKGILQIAFRITAQEAEEILGPKDFEAAPPKPSFGFGGPPKPPGAPAPDDEKKDDVTKVPPPPPKKDDEGDDEEDPITEDTK